MQVPLLANGAWIENPLGGYRALLTELGTAPFTRRGLWSQL
jgi:hypothetical protein